MIWSWFDDIFSQNETLAVFAGCYVRLISLPTTIVTWSDFQAKEHIIS